MAIIGLDLPLAAHGQDAVLQQHFDIALLQPREFGRDPMLHRLPAALSGATPPAG